MPNDFKLEIVYNKIPILSAQAANRANNTVYEWANEILHVAQRKIENPPKTGKVYTRGSVSHQASAPGESPADDTGNLRNDAGIENAGTAKKDIVFYSEYAAPLEFGHYAGEKEPVWVYARPFLTPALMEKKDAFFADMTKVLTHVK